MTTRTAPQLVTDVTGLNAIPVWAVAVPESVADVQDALRRSIGPVSIGGGRFSMGGQAASPGSLHLDMRRLNRVLDFSPERATIRVQAGIRWCDVQQFVDPHGFAVKIMQTYANFTVGGSLSVNVHGRYVGLGPLILSVRGIRMVLADGTVVDASATENAEIFHGAIGGYGGLGVIVEAELDLARNSRVERQAVKLPLGEYAAWFKRHVRNTREAVFHNADLYVPHCRTVRAVTWSETERAPTVPYRLQPHRRGYPLERYVLWAISETPFGRWRREFLIDPVVYRRRKVHWRNFEAGYDVAELEPPSRRHRTYALQEYFVPVDRLEKFVSRMAEILTRHRVNVLNVSIRHAMPDPGSLLAWARGETFAFVLYHKQRTRRNACERVAVWTRELIDAALAEGGAYYLPYQAHATQAQFHEAYPRAPEFFALKDRLDPDFRFRNVIWDAYYAPIREDTARDDGAPARQESEFHVVYDDTASRDRFYRFLQNIYRLFPEDRFHTLIREACADFADDESIYRTVQKRLPEIAPRMGALTFALPALRKQKREMLRQTLEILGERRQFDGYVEIGSTGRYLGVLRRPLALTGDLVLVNDVAPSYSAADIAERGGLLPRGRFVPLRAYAPIAEEDVASDSVDLVTCYVGLHHVEPEALGPFVASIARVLRPGGVFVLRDHHVTTPQAYAFVSLAHAVFNAGLGVPWETNRDEPRYFASLTHWVHQLDAAGLRDTGQRLLQAHDPTENVLMAFTKGAS
ncbi:MAG: FAD-binding protein [Betaproteobacteria bacterium]|nr:FAD-binding protein [Betaproteobacteria bacterium]